MRAFETQLEFSGEKGHAVVVDCGKPWRFVFWDKAQYVGCVDLGGGVWFTPEWCEVNSPNDLHCYEPIMDKQLRWSKIQLLEAGPARARVRWTYALNDMRYRIFHGDTRAEEIYTIYPDGIALREVILWPGTLNNHGGNANFWQVAEWILINAAGTSPLDVLKMPTPFTLSGGDGSGISVPWPLPPDWFEPLCRRYPAIADFPLYVGRIDLTGRPSPFLVIPKHQGLFPYMHCSACGRDHPYTSLFPGKDLINVYQHWPVTKMEDFLEWVPAGDSVGKVATHTSFSSVDYSRRLSGRDYVPTPDPGTTWYMLVGAAQEGADPSTLDALAQSYLNPAAVEVHRDPGEPLERHRGRVLLEGYDYSLRAYTFRKTGEDRMSLTMTPTVPQINPVFLVDGWTSPGVTVHVNGQALPAERYTAQVSGHDLTLWVEGTFAQPVEFAFTA